MVVAMPSRGALGCSQSRSALTLLGMGLRRDHPHLHRLYRFVYYRIAPTRVLHRDTAPWCSSTGITIYFGCSGVCRPSMRFAAPGGYVSRAWSRELVAEKTPPLGGFLAALCGFDIPLGMMKWPPNDLSVSRSDADLRL